MARAVPTSGNKPDVVFRPSCDSSLSSTRDRRNNYTRDATSMIRPTRGIARAARSQWRLASSSARASRQTTRASPPKQPPPLPPRIARPYKPSSCLHDRSGRRRADTPPPSSPPPPPPKSDTLLTLWRRSWLPLTGAALLAGFLGFYVFGTAAASFRTCPCEGACKHAAPTGRPPALTGENAEQFDKELDFGEWWMGISGLRRKLAGHATGHVLELAMGTGRNLEYYNWEPLSAAAEVANTGGKKAVAPQGVMSFTGLDISADMLDVARRRLVKTVPPMFSSGPMVKASTMADDTGGQLPYLDGHLRLINADAHHPLPPPAAATPDSKYDTVIQTFGLCSVSDPVAVLSNLASAVKPRTGRIILLEHGKGWYGIVNGLLDKNAVKHYEKYGCWWNRDIEALVVEAVRKTPGLEVVKLDRPNLLQMGTLVWVELRVADKAERKCTERCRIMARPVMNTAPEVEA
ncbi:Methyltransferase OMS1, mitochondrial [Tolypocladium capitatum]|uniref:Methyltransferase OMS1, mitochondrial n=1 Tax=Tolypocladium capitatum TaxID=45235 RepID=A0A2K3QKM4_9HYPO|nr:Methyltransferase OMS1, mitochondrial [Tolypocladium capitatum]